MDLCAIGARIKSARERAGMTQEDLAGALEMSPTHISVIERGVKSPKLETLVNIANASCVILIAEKVRMKHRYPCAVMGAPIIVSTRKMRVVGMQLQGFIRFCFQKS